MAIFPYPASVLMPVVPEPFPTLLDFLCLRFPRVNRECWERRLAEGKVLGENRSPVTVDSPYLPGSRLYYFREVEQEPEIPFTEEILFRNDQILACCKPHFLPVTPAGRYVEQCLVHRLRRVTGNDQLVPLHRIDRETAGVVLFSLNPGTRALYSRLFARGEVRKSYLAIAAAPRVPGERGWTVENRIVPGDPWFRMRAEDGPANARSRIELLETREGLARFRLAPETGKTHQLRIHMSGLGMPILNDRLYPSLQPRSEDDFAKPLQLLAKLLSFCDPLTGKQLEFESRRALLW